MNELLPRFIETFTRAILLEMDAMKRRLGSFEVPLSGGEGLSGVDTGDSTSENRKYRFFLDRAEPKLVPGIECTFRSDNRDVLVTIAGIDDFTVLVDSGSSLDTTASKKALVIYPWFLYERLTAAIERVANDPTLKPKSALRTFGKLPAGTLDMSAEPDVEDESSAIFASLNVGQIGAIRHCVPRDLAFIWGPPGTGKTTTLARLLLTLHARGERVLVASTTNAAVDQVASALSLLDLSGVELSPGAVVRLGRVSEESRAYSLDRIRSTLGQTRRAQSDHAYQAAEALTERVSKLEELSDTLKMIGSYGQLELFEPDEDDARLVRAFTQLFGDEGSRLAADANRDSIVESHLAQTRTELAEARGAILALRSTTEQTESEIVSAARLVLATMANLYVQDAVAHERFDTVIIEEAGMAVLPAVFYSASLARRRVLSIGDPRQLPPIVQSDSDYVRRAMGRSIFDVTVPEGVNAPTVALLTRQYRMHRDICTIVSDIFYEGALESDESVSDRDGIAERAPFPNRAVAVVDLGGATSCSRDVDGNSRINESSAIRTVELAAQAVESGIEAVAVITPYTAQAKLARRLLSERKVTGVECSTVHRFQGHERDCIIFDFTDAPPMTPGVLLSGDGFDRHSANLLNVSVSRARGKLILVAEVAFFAESEEYGTVNRLLALANRYA